MVRVLRLSSLAVVGLYVGAVVWSLPDSTVQAQSGKSKSKPKPISSADVKKLDAKLDEIHRSFLNDTASIIKGYEDAGQPDRAKTILEVLLKLDPKNDQIKKKIEQLDEHMLESSEFDIDLDPSKPWQQVGAVAKDRLIRLVVDGDYKFVASTTVGPEGFPTKDPANDLYGGAPLGAVIAVIVPSGAGESGNNPNAKPPNPFNVGAKFEQAAQRDGMLLIKVNVPPGSKCTGKLKVKVGGVSRSS